MNNQKIHHEHLTGIIGSLKKHVWTHGYFQKKENPTYNISRIYYENNTRYIMNTLVVIQDTDRKYYGNNCIILYKKIVQVKITKRSWIKKKIH